MRRFLLSTSLVALAMLVLIMPATAGRRWCARDPIVRLNGTEVQMWIAIEEQYVPYVNGPIDVKVYLPQDVDREIILLDDGYNNYGETLTWGELFVGDCAVSCVPATVNADGSFDARVRASVPVDAKQLQKHFRMKRIPLQLTIIHEDGTTEVIEMLNDGAKIDFDVTGKVK